MDSNCTDLTLPSDGYEDLADANLFGIGNGTLLEHALDDFFHAAATDPGFTSLEITVPSLDVLLSSDQTQYPAPDVGEEFDFVNYWDLPPGPAAAVSEVGTEEFFDSLNGVGRITELSDTEDVDNEANVQQSAVTEGAIVKYVGNAGIVQQSVATEGALVKYVGNAGSVQQSVAVDEEDIAETLGNEADAQHSVVAEEAKVESIHNEANVHQSVVAEAANIETVGNEANVQQPVVAEEANVENPRSNIQMSYGDNNQTKASNQVDKSEPQNTSESQNLDETTLQAIMNFSNSLTDDDLFQLTPESEHLPTPTPVHNYSTPNSQYVNEYVNTGIYHQQYNFPPLSSQLLETPKGDKPGNTYRYSYTQEIPKKVISQNLHPYTTPTAFPNNGLTKLLTAPVTPSTNPDSNPPSSPTDTSTMKRKSRTVRTVRQPRASRDQIDALVSSISAEDARAFFLAKASSLPYTPFPSPAPSPPTLLQPQPFPSIHAAKQRLDRTGPGIATRALPLLTDDVHLANDALITLIGNLIFNALSTAPAPAPPQISSVPDKIKFNKVQNDAFKRVQKLLSFREIALDAQARCVLVVDAAHRLHTRGIPVADLDADKLAKGKLQAGGFAVDTESTFLVRMHKIMSIVGGNKLVALDVLNGSPGVEALVRSPRECVHRKVLNFRGNDTKAKLTEMGLGVVESKKRKVEAEAEAEDEEFAGGEEGNKRVKGDEEEGDKEGSGSEGLGKAEE